MSTRGGMFSERIIGQSERMYKGEVYVEKGRKSLDSALIIEGLNSECYLIVRDTSARDTVHDFIPIQLSKKPSDFLRDYDKATPEQVAELIVSLKEKQGVISEKIGFLEQYTQTAHRPADPLEWRCCPDSH